MVGEKNDGTTIQWHVFVTEIPEKFYEDHIFELITTDDFDNMMMVTKFPDADNKEEVEQPTLEPKVCTYKKNASGYEMTIEITYISKMKFL